jgi:hypothetical protein
VQVGSPWVCYISTMVYVCNMRWTLPDGRIGYGVSQENHAIQLLNSQRGKVWADQQSKITS